MELTSSRTLLSSYSGSGILISSSKPHHFPINSFLFPKNPGGCGGLLFSSAITAPLRIRTSTSLLHPSALVIEDEILHNSSAGGGSVPPSSSPAEMMPKIDKSGRFCSPRAARELALLILYAACLEGSDPVRLFEKRINARWETGYQFDKESLMEYDHMSFGGPPVTTDTVEEADELLSKNQKESEIEAEVLSAPPKMVYSKLILRFTRKLLVAVAENWDNDVIAINKITPQNWKNQPAGRILELSILHLAMSEIAVLGTRQPIVINEAVDLSKRFCDGAAPRVINGCLRTFVKDLRRPSETQKPENQKMSG